MTDFGTMDPNSQNQRWSYWVFGVESPVKQPDALREVKPNAARYFAKLFGTVARARVTQQGTYYLLEVEVEGPPVHDPGYRSAVAKDFKHRFMRPGFGPSSALVRFDGVLKAGSAEDGSAADQWLVMPHLSVTTLLWGESGQPEQTLGVPLIHSTRMWGS